MELKRKIIPSLDELIDVETFQAEQLGLFNVILILFTAPALKCEMARVC